MLRFSPLTPSHSALRCTSRFSSPPEVCPASHDRKAPLHHDATLRTHASSLHHLHFASHSALLLKTPRERLRLCFRRFAFAGVSAWLCPTASSSFIYSTAYYPLPLAPSVRHVSLGTTPRSLTHSFRLRTSLGLTAHSVPAFTPRSYGSFVLCLSPHIALHTSLCAPRSSHSGLSTSSCSPRRNSTNSREPRSLPRHARSVRWDSALRLAPALVPCAWHLLSPASLPCSRSLDLLPPWTFSRLRSFLSTSLHALRFLATPRSLPRSSLHSPLSTLSPRSRARAQLSSLSPRSSRSLS
jgi:hypothetical protein